MDRLSTRVMMPSGQRSTVLTPNPFVATPSDPLRFEDTSNATTYNFNNIPVVDGLLILSIHAGENVVSLSSVTVDGSAATVHCSVNNPASGAATAGIASYLLPGGTSTANVSVTFNATSERCALGCYILSNSTQYRFVSANTVESTNPTSHTLSLNNLPNDSTIIVAVTHTNAGESITFTGVTGNHEQIGGEGTEYGYAYKKNHDEGNITVTSTYPSASNKAVMAIAAFV